LARCVKEAGTKLKHLAVEFSTKHIKSLRDLYVTVAHELRHIWQYVTGFSGDRESDAESWAQQKYGSTPDVAIEK
jgi:hypothetical protein